MRALKRWFRRRMAFFAVRPQLRACRPHLERLFGGPVAWRHTGGRGRDVVCLILQSHQPVGVLRLVHPETPFSAPASAGLPFVSLSSADKIRREWQAYTTGSEKGLTPQPLWRDEGAMLCAYADAQPLEQLATKRCASRLALATGALEQIARLHAAGLSHMDMSLSNILCAKVGQRLLFVDFEYGPAAGLTFEQQCLYDYLRLLESIWKFLPACERASAAGVWGEAFLRVAPARVLAAELAPLRPALGRILAAAELAPLFSALAAAHG